MKMGKTLQELAAEITRQNEVKKDYLADTPCLSLTVSDTGFAMEMRDEDGTVINSLAMNEIAHRQIGEHMKIPAKYYDRMRSEFPELLRDNVNGWFNRTPTKRMVRTLDGTARAFLSERYRCIDNFDIANAVLPILGEMEIDQQNSSFEITDSKMYLKIVNPRLEGEVTKGDIVQAGIMISNSETGQGSVNVQPLIFRLVCLNGMVTNIGERKYHVGRGNESGENFELYRNETLEANDRAFMMKVQDLVRTAVDETKFNDILKIMRDATEVKITGRDIPKVVELTGREYSLNKDEEQGILYHLIAGGDLSMYGLSGAFTRHSQDVDSYDRATELETMGWSVLNMPRKRWELINSEV
jgi:hypothetical protein